MGRSYVRRGVSMPPWWEPRRGDVVYLEGRKTKISRVGTSDGTPYVWFRPQAGGTIAMSVRNLRQAAYVDEGSLHPPSYAKQNPLKIGKWIKAKIKKLRNGKFRIEVPGYGLPYGMTPKDR